MAYETMLAEVIQVTGHGGKNIAAYVARPLGAGPYPGVVLIHHAPGWDEWYREATRKMAHHGYIAISPNLYNDAGEGTPDDVAAKIRALGGVSDADVVADAEGSIRYLRSVPSCNGKVGVMGTCSGGRQSYLIACKSKEKVDAVVNMWGGGSVMAPADLTPKRPQSPHEMTGSLPCPVLGIFGNDDRAPTPEQVNTLEAELKKQHKDYEFHRYDGAGHGFFYYDRPAYRQEQAVDGWKKIFAFFEKNLDVKIPVAAAR